MSKTDVEYEEGGVRWSRSEPSAWALIVTGVLAIAFAIGWLVFTPVWLFEDMDAEKASDNAVVFVFVVIFGPAACSLWVAWRAAKRILGED